MAVSTRDRKTSETRRSDTATYDASSSFVERLLQPGELLDYEDVSALVRCEGLSGIALGGTETVLILFRNSDEEPQSLIHGSGVWEDFRHIRFQPDYITEMPPSWTQLPDAKT